MGALAPERPGYPVWADVAARVPHPAGPPAARNRTPHLVAGLDETVGPAARTGVPDEESRGW
ncbi:hypothetical protein BKH20_09775 [Actinomyces oris]|uniref:Uncharacterized protein n=1 Tax=Actinomyces oris TaxID=544580 RepID=A0A1Q8WLL1_9ACTO|nr:hypothetical protein BKH20_09775 [Actinomyces oris]